MRKYTVLNEKMKAEGEEINPFHEAMKSFWENNNMTDEMYRYKDFTDVSERHRDLNGEDIPFVCTKIPTGGGKTIVACNMLKTIMNEYLYQRDGKGIVVWLTPSETITTQTLNSLKNNKHPYHIYLKNEFGDVRIFDVESARMIRKNDIEDNLCIIVSTIGSFKRDKKDYLKNYQENGNLIYFDPKLAHNKTKFLDKDGELANTHTDITTSLINVIRMTNPVIIIDEGHNAKTDLSYEMLADMNPSFILEYTATPTIEKSNILVNVHPGMLKDEDMIKMPLIFTNSEKWEDAVNLGIKQQNELEVIANREYDTSNEYIRPIVLIQAEYEMEKDGKGHVDAVKKHLMSNNVPEGQIAIRTGNINELRNIDLKSNECEKRYIITVKALNEGWDEAFPYVLVTLINHDSKRAIEQIIGRVLRLPNQKRKTHEELNNAYVFSASSSFATALNSLEYALNENGYEHLETPIISRNRGERVHNVTISHTRTDQSIKLSCIAINSDDKTRRISFHDDLLGSEFTLSKQKIPKQITMNDENWMAKIDVKYDKIIQETMESYLFTGKNNMTLDALIQWLDKHLIMKEYSQEDKIGYLKKILMSWKYKPENFTIDKHMLAKYIHEHIQHVENKKAEEQFYKLKTSNGLVLDYAYYKIPDTFEHYATTRTPFAKHVFENAGLMNREEESCANAIDSHENVICWYRNIDKRDFFIQGWRKYRFYPDFLVKMNSGKCVVVEYKGGHMKNSDDTVYKEKLGHVWADLTNESGFGNPVGFIMMYSEDIPKIGELLDDA